MNTLIGAIEGAVRANPKLALALTLVLTALFEYLTGIHVETPVDEAAKAAGV